MKANELMIWDWIRKEDTFGQVVDIEQKEKYAIIGVELIGNGYDVYTVDALEPIPLTPEILEKNGFTRFGTDYILKERHFGLKNPSISNNYLNNYWLRVSTKAIHIEYVHQLQHALRLCGIKKEIEL